MRKRVWLFLIVACILVLLGIRFFSAENPQLCDDTNSVNCSGGKLLFSQNISMKISSDFLDKGPLPSMYTCDGEGRFPTLKVEDIPAGVKTLALVVDDPDAPAGTRDHLLLANILLTEDPYVIISQDTFSQSVFGQNSRGEQAWGAPCPPGGTHRYVFKVYALSDRLEISSGFSKERLIELMGGKIVGQSQIVGLYKRQ